MQAQNIEGLILDTPRYGDPWCVVLRAKDKWKKVCESRGESIVWPGVAK